MHIQQITKAFRLNGVPTNWVEFGHGHINSTFKVTTDTGAEYILQKINKYVFRNPIRLMSNVSAVTDYLRTKVDDCRMAMHFIPTVRGLYYYRDSEGEFWRMYDFMRGFCLDAPESDEDFYQSGLAFGRFQELLSEFPADTLYETIPEFHNTIDRYKQFKNSVSIDPCGRAAGVQEEINFVLSHEEVGSTLQKMRVSGQLPLRVTHNDTKLNNVLLDRDTRKSLCVLDLDTVMPGLSVYDFGDSIRFGAATAAEDEQDLSKMSMDLHMFEVYTKGFLEAATALTEKEVEMLPMGALVMTLEVGLRFLKDYLDGDLYFKTAYPEHNLVRARTQLKLVADMEAKMDEMNRIVAEVKAAVRGN
ncbi:MAG: aminoglycoside phosphotransferase family protein [Ruminococcaceae bacterium]|nr:aminoglycoside phosphotransferase family protein [Oscillospiraceae bacterium]